MTKLGRDSSKNGQLLLLATYILFLFIYLTPATHWLHTGVAEINTVETPGILAV